MNQISSLQITFIIAVTPKVLLEDLPALQELTILWECDYFDCTRAIGQSISQLPSTLRSFSVTDWFIFSSERLSSFNPVWAHLINVELAIYLLNVSRLLRLCLNLSSCNIVLYEPFTYADFQFPEPFTHANLRSLRIICSPWRRSNPLPKLFIALTLPNLRVLEAQSYGIIQWPHEEFKELLARSHCPLERLICNHPVMASNEQHRAEYIALIPSLQVDFTFHPGF